MIEECEGYKKLHQAILDDTKSGRTLERRMEALTFAVSRANHYAEKLGVLASDVLNSWESRRDYWYLNYYQDANQPRIDSDGVRVFETSEDLISAIGRDGFRCPYCKGVSTDPYACNSGIKVILLNTDKKGEICNWKVYGLLADLGKGVFVFVKEKMRGQRIFMPIAWEASNELVLK